MIASVGFRMQWQLAKQALCVKEPPLEVLQGASRIQHIVTQHSMFTSLYQQDLSRLQASKATHADLKGNITPATSHLPLLQLHVGA